MLRVYSPYGRIAGSARVRVFQWIERLRIDAQISDYAGLGSNRPPVLLRNVGGVLRAEFGLRRERPNDDDFVLVHREASPFSTGGLEARLLSASQLGVFDIDDGMFIRAPQRVALHRAAKTRTLMSISDRIIAGSHAIADVASDYNSSVVYIPSCIDPQEYRRKRDYRLATEPTIGWLGSRASEGALVDLVPAFSSLWRRFGARLRIVGSPSGPMDEHASPWLERVPWKPERWAEDLRSFDVGIMPLRRTEWERYKCSYKLLQYAAAGVPALAEAFGENVYVLRKLGLQGVDAGEWEERLAQVLQSSREERQRVASRAMAAVHRSFSYETWQAAWLRAVTSG